LKQVVEANTAYEKKMCDQAVEQELDATQIAELERLQANTATENARMKRALEEDSRRKASLEEEIISLKKGKKQ